MYSEKAKKYKLKEIEKHIEGIMDILGIYRNDSTEGTPRRIAKMYMDELFSSLKPDSLQELNNKMKLFDNTMEDADLIVVKDIPFYSTCEHHFLPFFGKVAIGYVPGDKILGLSKFPRIVKYFSKLPQLQERLTSDIANYVADITECKLVIVKIYDTTHTCCTARGVESEGSTNTFKVITNESIDINTIWRIRNQFNNEVK